MAKDDPRCVLVSVNKQDATIPRELRNISIRNANQNSWQRPLKLVRRRSLELRSRLTHRHDRFSNHFTMTSIHGEEALSHDRDAFWNELGGCSHEEN